MDNNFSIGNRIRELRNQKHLSQEQLALSAEITTAYLGADRKENEKESDGCSGRKVMWGIRNRTFRFFSRKRKCHKTDWTH